jgi:hypothetical protein
MQASEDKCIVIICISCINSCIYKLKLNEIFYILYNNQELHFDKDYQQNWNLHSLNWQSLKIKESYNRYRLSYKE